MTAPTETHAWIEFLSRALPYAFMCVAFGLGQRAARVRELAEREEEEKS